MNSIIGPIEIINYKGETTNSVIDSNLALSGYALPITPFTFKAKFNIAYLPGSLGFQYLYTENSSYISTELLQSVFPGYLLTTEFLNQATVSDKRVVWDFGDGTYSTGLTSTHVYDKPGVYTINTYFFNSTGGVYKNTISPSITCYNFIQDTFNVTVSSTYITSGQYILTAGRIENPFTISTQSSWQNVGEGDTNKTTFGLKLLSGTSNYFIQNLDSNKYGHLYPFSSFYDIDSDGNFIEIEEISIDRTPIYCALSGTQLYITTKDNLSSVLCGVSGSKNVYVKDDRSGHREISVYLKSFDYNNVLPIILNCDFVNDTFKSLAFSSNGITGEGKIDNTFNIDEIKYVGQRINFVVTLKDGGYFTIKNNRNLLVDDIGEFPYISLYSINEAGNIDPSLGSFYTNFSYLTSVSGGFYRGTFIPAVSANNIKIAAVTNFGGVSSYLTPDYPPLYLALNDPSLVFSLDDSISTINPVSAYTNSFTVYPSSGRYKIAKVNEDFDFSGTLNNLRYQEFLLDKSVLFDDFLGTAFGGISSEPMAPGKLAYEKISNFASNNIDVYKSNLQALLSMNSMVGGELDVYDTTNFGVPSKLKRLVDIVSINHSRLWGSRNTFNENFNNYLGADSETYGLNLGNRLDFYTTVLTSGIDGYIVALEKYSNRYVKCSTYVSLISTPTLSTTLSTYALSSYNDTWGWPLTLTPGMSSGLVPTYYDFYEFIPTPENSHYNNVINFNDPFTTISYNMSSYSDWVKKGGIVEEMIDHILYTGTGLLSS